MFAFTTRTTSSRCSARLTRPESSYQRTFSTSPRPQVFDHAQAFIAKFEEGQGAKDLPQLKETENILQNSLKEELSTVSVSEVHPVPSIWDKAGCPRDPEFVDFERVTGK